MNRKTIRIIIFLATLSLIGIVATQIFWVKEAYNLQEKQFNERVRVALNNVTNELLSIHEDESELFNPVKQVSSNYFVTLINDTVNPYLLQNLLKNEFTERNIKIDFEYVIYDCFTDSIVFGDTCHWMPRNKINCKPNPITWNGIEMVTTLVFTSLLNKPIC